MHGEAEAERQWVVADVSRAGLVTQGVLIAAVGSVVGWFATPGGWRFLAIGIATALGATLGLFGRTSAFWIEGGGRSAGERETGSHVYR